MMPTLRVARRDVWRNKGRALLVVLMIALPVAAVVGADVFLRTADISGAERLEWRVGAADARVQVEPGVRDVEHGPDPERSGWGQMDAAEVDPVRLDDVRRILGRDVPAIEWRTDTGRVPVDAGTASPELHEVDLSDPLAEGLFTLLDGRLPDAETEVVISERLADRGIALGDTVPVSGSESEQPVDRTVVGIVEWAGSRYPMMAGPLGSLGATSVPGSTTWLIGGGDVTWAEVRALNRVGATVTSRAVLLDPPPASELPEGLAPGTDSAVVAVFGMVIAMVLLEVVLLAGPAFAVTARRQARTIALMVATGATPAQARRVVLGGAVVLGTVAAGVGVAVGVAGAAAAVAVVSRFGDGRLGPFEVVPLDLLVVAGFGILSAVLAAVVPAVIAARQDVVAVLAGRRGDRAPSLRSPLLGLVLLGVGIAAAVYGVVSSGSEIFISLSAIPAVLGMILLVPVLVAGLARISSGLPLPLRYAVRDANRHRTRTAPAIAAVAATVVGAVALGIGASSDAKEAEVMYAPELPMHTSALSWRPWDEETRDPAVWARLRTVVERELPGERLTEVHGTPATVYPGFTLVGNEDSWLLDNWSSSWGTELLVADRLEGPLARVVPSEELEAANAALAAGEAVVLTSRPVQADQVRLDLNEESGQGASAGVDVSAHFVAVGREALAIGVVPPKVLDDLGLTPEVTALAVDAVVPGAVATTIQEGVAQITEEAYLTVERGYQNDRETLIVLLVLGGLAGVLMLGGTLTATFLSLSDARADLASLAAVGAAPRMRRAVAASYALFIGGLGAVLGALVGFVPGIAVTFPLTSTEWYGVAPDPDLPSHFLAVPWALIGTVVVALPLLTAAVVWLSARSRLPMVARID